MSLLNSYAIWNNKGGVGKSTITFHLASRYAEKYPDRKVLVVDLCPQSNSSMMLLGGGDAGEARVLQFCTEASPRTVVGYLSTVISSGSGAPLPSPQDFIIKVAECNQRMPQNLFLLCGDGNLEPMSPAISAAASAPALTPTAKPWRWIHEIFKKLIDQASSEDDREWLVLVDTNPSFSIYTELALSAVEQIITPVNADDSSRVATNAMFLLLHGQKPPHPVYGSWTFANLAHQNGLRVPKIHLVIGNRLTQYSGAAAAFKALSDATADALFSSYQSHPSYFANRSGEINNVSDFREEYSHSLRDFNTAGVVCAHLGMLLSQMHQEYYLVHGTNVKVNKERIKECEDAVDEIIGRI